MLKVIAEIVRLLWKVLRFVLWRRVRPVLRRMATYAVLALGLAVLVLWIVKRG